MLVRGIEIAPKLYLQDEAAMLAQEEEGRLDG